MSLEEIKQAAKEYGYKLTKIPDYDCACYRDYPNKPRCLECFYPIKFKQIRSGGKKTRCKRKNP